MKIPFLAENRKSRKWPNSPFSAPKTKASFGRLLVWWLDLSDPDPLRFYNRSTPLPYSKTLVGYGDGRSNWCPCAVCGRRAISYAIDIDISIISAPADSAMSPAALWRHVYVTHHQDDVVSEGGCEEENKAYQVQLGRLCRLHVLQVRVWEGESFVACRYVAMGVHVFYMLILNVGKTAKISRKTSLDFRYCY